MGWFQRTALVCGVFCALIMWLPIAEGYPTPVDFDGSIQRWEIGPADGPISYEVVADSLDDADYFGFAVDRAAELWGAVASSYYRLRRAKSGETAKITVHLESVLDNAPYSAGYTVFDETQDKHPMHCSIFIIADRAASYFAFAKTILHELGHCAGLGHSLIPEAIMSYSLNKNAFRLDLDDKAGLSRLYPGDGENPRLPLGCSVTRGGTGKNVGLFLLVAILIFAFCRRGQLHSARD